MDDAAPHLEGELATAVPQLAPGEVHVWCWSLQVEGAEDLIERLSVLEVARAQRFVHRHHARRYVVAHARMRELLETYCGGKHVALGAGARGKPYVLGNSGLEFSLSHSEEVAVLAVAREISLGVDVERVRYGGSPPVEQLSAREQASLHGLFGVERVTAFYRCWTRKEAVLKGVGIGLHGDLGMFDALPGRDRVTVSSKAALEMRALEGWRLLEFDFAAGYVGFVGDAG